MATSWTTRKYSVFALHHPSRIKRQLIGEIEIFRNEGEDRLVDDSVEEMQKMFELVPIKGD